MRHKVSAALCTAVLLLATACTPAPIVTIPSASQSVGQAPLIVGIPEVPDGVLPAEGALLAHVYAAALNAAGLKSSVAEAPAKTGTLVSGLTAGSYDVAPAYSRLVLSEVSSAPAPADPGEVLSELAAALPAGVILMDATKAEDRDNMVVTAVTAEKYKLKSIADLAKVCDKLTMGGSADFKGSTGGLPALDRDYKCVPKAYESLLPTLATSNDGIVWSLLRDDIQVADIHSSSPAIADNSLVVLSDPEQLFVAQTIVPLVAKDKLSTDVQDLLNKVSAAMNTEELANLNRLSQDRHYGDDSEVAEAWLVQKGLIKASS
ncbi:hypothetical protein ART_1947 [Arthrobacter sp. PAMC 25486]|uniref:ABC transporter substrate-binding protein n=1 Tax=Arthrobacter sp. PAMC 25486 TaxID=1494608 RepID=UPI0005362AD7|nr:ABC transporter substrate-binding protein [Arthrobacter sp. PAMC 25486]AIY01546.1 hypothetical protein ART_1947 [Arthrobacter sp. PAMC 25486]